MNPTVIGIICFFGGMVLGFIALAVLIFPRMSELEDTVHGLREYNRYLLEEDTELTP